MNTERPEIEIEDLNKELMDRLPSSSDPDRKGEGIGSRMLQECLIPYVKEHGGKKLCLFTNSQGNRQFYRKNGFTEFDERQFAYKGKTIGSWSLQKIIQN